MFPSQLSQDSGGALVSGRHVSDPQFPEPSHLPVALGAVHVADPAATGVQVPELPHVVHWGHEAEPQQNPLGQLPLVHCVPLVHARPFGSVASQVEPLQ